MSILPILHYPDPRLRRPALPVAAVDDAVRQVAGDMLETMYDAEGRGLAAPQVGVMRRVFVMDLYWKDGPADPLVCINPELIAASDEVAACTEGCLSIPGIRADVSRPARITLRWTGLDGAAQSADLEGIASVCAQHELDHLNGRLCIDLMEEAARAEASAALRGMAP